MALFGDTISSLAELIVKENFNKGFTICYFGEKDNKTFIVLLLSALICYLR